MGVVMEDMKILTLFLKKIDWEIHVKVSKP